MPTESVSPKDATASFHAGLVAALPHPQPVKAAPAPEAKAAAIEAKPVTEEVKTAAPDPKPQAAPVEDKIPRTAQEWKKFTTKRDADIKERDERIAKAEAKAAEFETKLKAGIPNPELDKLKTDLETLRKERDEYDERLKVVAITQHPRFKKEFEERLAGQIALAKKIVPAEQQETVERILSLPDGAFKDARVEELMDALSPVQVSRIGAILNAVTEINSQKQDIIANAKEEYDKMTAAQQAQVKQRADAMEQALKESLAKAPEHPLYKKSEDAEWNKDVDARLQQAEQLARSSLSVGDSTRIVLDHLALPVVQKQLEASKAEVEKLKAQISDFASANPGIVSRSQDAGVDDGAGIPVRIREGSTPQEAAASWVKSLPKWG